ncbi:MobC family plasmid mobilization relaxosome protein [Streptococcus dentiloxodontae]
MTNEEAKRSRPILKRFFVDEAENEAIKTRLADSGLTSFSRFARTMLLTGEVKVVNVEGLQELQTEINRIGTNVNQIARVANTDGSISPEQLVDVLTQLEDIRGLMTETLKEVKKTLGEQETWL